MTQGLGFDPSSSFFFFFFFFFPQTPILLELALGNGCPSLKSQKIMQSEIFFGLYVFVMCVSCVINS
jgi:hypothetical protein